MAPNKSQGRGPPQGGSLLNLERMPALAPKYANQIGKTCTQFRVLYTATGVNTEVFSTVDSNGGDSPVRTDGSRHGEWISIPEWERRRALRNAPSDEERLTALVRKYELRLNRAFPTGGAPASGSEEAIQAWLGTLPFAQRRALLMSQRDFQKSFPDGFRDP